MRATIRVLLPMFFASWAQFPGIAQQLGATGAIYGIVEDPSGAAVPGAQVQVENASKSVKRTTVTDPGGAFSVLALPPAQGYTIMVAKSGFAVQEQGGVSVYVGEDLHLLFKLRIETISSGIPVEGTLPLANTTKTNVSQVIENAQISNLPINGRRVDSYVLLTPGVVPDGVQGLVSFRGMAGGNAFLTDGNDTSNQFFSENAGRTRVYTQISQDAVQEFQVLSSGYSAEYGRATGGIINTVTHSGSNALHGTAYWFFRNRTLNARDPFSPVNPPEVRHQAGASVGGPVVKDRLFFFFNTEVNRRNFPLVASLARQPLFDLAGNFIGVCGATPQQCLAARQFLARQFQVLPRRADSELAFGRLDWSPTDRHRLSASFNYLRWISPNGFQTQAVLNDGSGIGDNGDSSVRTRYGRMSWTAVPSSSIVNELRFGWMKDRHSDNHNPDLIPQTGLVQITVEGQPYLGMNAELPRIDPSENRFQIAETLVAVHGRHSMKFGGDFITTEDYLEYLSNSHGSYVYADFTSFAEDFSGNVDGGRRWQSYSQRFGNQVYDHTIRDYDAFAEDQIQLAPNLTASLGLRYEYASLPRSPRVAEFLDARLSSVKTNFAPRIGLSLGFNRSRSVVRLGYGVFYGRYPAGAISTFFLESGVFQQSVALDTRFLTDPRFGPVFPNPLPPLDASKLPGSSNPNFASTIDLTLPSKDFRNGFTHQADVGLEHAVSSTFSVGATYLANRALHLTTVRDLNIGPPGPPVTYNILNTQGQVAGTYTTPTYRLVNRMDPQWRRVNSVESGGRSYYDGLVLQARKRAGNGFAGTLSYAWSHTIDFNQGGGADNLFYNDGPRSLWNGDYRADKASSQLDQRHRLVVSTIWEPEFHTNNRVLERWLVNGWRLSQISIFASAQPTSSTVLIASGVPFAGAAFNTTLNGFGGSDRVPFLPGSDLNIDQVIRTDARLSKVLRFAERYELHLNFEAFNVFNHVAGTAVNTTAYEERAGILTPIPHGNIVESQGYPDGTNARRSQVSLRFIW